MSEGELKIDDYQLINCIATGNYSQVWEASLGGSSEHVAIKVLLPDALKERDQVAVLKHEGRVAKLMEHPQFLRFHKAVFNRKNGYLVMEYFNAPNTKTLLLNDPLAIQVRFRKLVESLCLALGYMHEKGWLHRDLKPDNILFNRASELKLIDFSLASRWSTGLGKVFSGKSKAIQGTRTYIAPETLLKKPPTPQTDMYSLGVTLFELLTAQPPFKGTSPRDLLKRHLEEKPPMVSAFNKNVTPELDRFVLRLLAKKPADRHKTMTEVHTEFRSLKMFKEEPQDLAQRHAAERKKKELDALASLDKRLDSRADAKRTELGTHPPAAPKKKAPKPQPEKQPAAAAQAPQQQPMSPPPGYWPPPQGMPPGGWPYPFPPPGQGQGPPPGMPPGYPPQFAPGYPPQYAPAGGPQQPPQGSAPPGAVPAHVPLRQPPPPGGRPPQNGPAPAPAEQQPRGNEQAPKRAPQPAPPPPAKENKPNDDLPFMDELPEVI